MQNAIACTRLLSRAFLSGIYNRNASGLPNPRSDSKKEDTSGESASETPPKNTGNETQEDLQIPKPRVVSGVSGIPKNINMRKLNPFQFGDDSCFISQHNTADVFGVADGVGGWRQYGVDPGTFSDALMRACERVVRAGTFRPQQPAQLLATAYAEVMASKQPIVGSSTACVLVLASGWLHAANIGDSGFLLVRDGRVLLRSEEQQHYFNTPYQLSNAPPGQNGQVLSDRPEAARTSEMAVQAGDVIMLGTDGVFDNLPDALLVRELSGLHGCADRARLQATANTIALMARRLALDGTFMSPFAKNALTHGIEAVGGKPDDITVILATVVS